MSANINWPTNSDMETTESLFADRNMQLESHQQLERLKNFANRNSNVFGRDMSAMLSQALKNPRTDARLMALIESTGIMRALGGNTLAISNAAFLGSTTGAFNVSGGPDGFMQQTLLRDPRGGVGAYHADAARRVSQEIQGRSFLPNGQINYNYTRGFQTEAIGEVMKYAGNMGAFRGPGMEVNTGSGVKRIGDEMKHMLKAVENIQEVFDTPDVRQSFQKMEQLGLRGGMRMDAQRMAQITGQIKTMARSTGLGARELGDYMEMSSGQFASMGFHGGMQSSMAMGSLAFAAAAQGSSNMDFAGLQKGYTELMGRASSTMPAKTMAYLIGQRSKGLLTPGASAALVQAEMTGDTEHLNRAVGLYASEGNTTATSIWGVIQGARGVQDLIQPGDSAGMANLQAFTIKAAGKRVNEQIARRMDRRLGSGHSWIRDEFLRQRQLGVSTESAIASLGLSAGDARGLRQDVLDAETQIGTYGSPEFKAAAIQASKGIVGDQATKIMNQSAMEGMLSSSEAFDASKASTSQVMAQAMLESDPEKQRAIGKSRGMLTLGKTDLDKLSRMGLLARGIRREHIEELQATWKDTKKSEKERQAARRELNMDRIELQSEFERKDPEGFKKYMATDRAKDKPKAEGGKAGFPSSIKIKNAQEHVIGSLEFLNE